MLAIIVFYAFIMRDPKPTKLTPVQHKICD